MKFVTLVNFTEQGFNTIEQSPGRAEAFTKQAEKSGLEISEILWLNGRFDGLIAFDAPDMETASAVMLRLSKAGFVKTETLPAFDAKEIRQVIDKL